MKKHTSIQNILIISWCILIITSCSQKISETQEKAYISFESTQLYASADSQWVNVIIEIPAGTNEKWEFNYNSSIIEWEKANEDSFRVVKYLPYPANYGFLPQTLLSVAQSGDGDCLDVFLLGKAVSRNNIIPARILGVIHMLDKGEQDDKIIAVPNHIWFSHISNMQELDSTFPGTIEIITLWLKNYKGSSGNTIIQNIGDADAAKKILTNANAIYLENK